MNNEFDRIAQQIYTRYAPQAGGGAAVPKVDQSALTLDQQISKIKAEARREAIAMLEACANAGLSAREALAHVGAENSPVVQLAIKRRDEWRAQRAGHQPAQ